MFIGIVFLILGILFLLEMIIPGFQINFSFIWPMILIAFAIAQMWKQKHSDLFMWILIFIGAWALLRELNIIPEEYRRLMWPILMILIGIVIIIQTITFKKNIKVKIIDGITNYYGIFSGVEEKIQDDQYVGANIYAIFGGVNLDLREVKIKGSEITMNVYSIFGGTELIMPNDFNIEVNAISIFGGTDNECGRKKDDSKPTIYINCYSIFGGTDIK